jgi:uncharacterized repeat protein (TIGR02543 family)
VFKGWYNGETQVEDGTWAIEEDVTLTASWEAKVYTIVFSYGEVETAVPENYTVTFDAEYNVTTLANIIPSAANYNFKGWKLQNTEIVLDEADEMVGVWTYTDTYDGTDDNTFTFVAQWAKIYTINYVSNGAASVDLTGLTTTFEEGQTLTLQSVTDKNGDYSFVGWTINGTVYTSITAELLESLGVEGTTVTVTAKWKDKGNWTQNY